MSSRLLLFILLFTLLDAKPNAIKDKIYIVSKYFYLYADKQKAIFKKDVIANNGANVVKSDTMVVFFDKDNHPIMYKGFGNVFFHAVDERNGNVYDVTLEKVTYNFKSRIYIFENNVVLTDRKNKHVLKGDYIIYDEKTGIIKIKNINKNYIKMLFNIKSL